MSRWLPTHGRYRARELPEQPRATVFVPTRNEAEHIGQTLEAMLRQDYPKELMHVVIVDGMSTDGTRDIASQVLSAQNEVTWEIVDNPNLDLTSANYVAYEHMRGDVFVYVCAHAIIAPDYVSAVCRGLREVPCDGIGGPYRMAGHTSTGKSIAAAMSSPFGVGGARYRYFEGDEPLDMDPPMASYRIDVFRQLGGLDPVTVGYGEDWEYYRRVRAAGGRLFCDPRAKLQFYARESFWVYFRHMMKYGAAKAFLVRRHGAAIMRPSNFIPALWVLCLAGFSALSVLGHTWALYALAAGAGGYLVAGAWSAARACQSQGYPTSLAPGVLWAFILMHTAYGVGFLKTLVAGRGRGVERQAGAVHETLHRGAAETP